MIGSLATSSAPLGDGLSPDQWQDYVNRLAAADAASRGAVYQTMPDKTKGDGGLEGFTTDGHGFQAYCPEAGKTPAQLKAALCSKISTDMSKLERYRSYWEPTLMGRPLRFWRMVVPSKALRNKAVVGHAAARAQDCVKRGLPFIDPSFQAIVSIPADFVAAMKIIALSNGELVAPPSVEVSDAAMRAFEAERQAKINVLDGKLRQLPRLSDETKLVTFRRQLLRHYMDYTNALDWLGQLDPAIREQIISKREGVRRSVETKNLVATSQPPERLEEARIEFKQELDRVASFIESTRRDHMSWGVVAEWLLECPLDFPP